MNGSVPIRSTPGSKLSPDFGDEALRPRTAIDGLLPNEKSKLFYGTSVVGIFQPDDGPYTWLLALTFDLLYLTLASEVTERGRKSLEFVEYMTYF